MLTSEVDFLLCLMCLEATAVTARQPRTKPSEQFQAACDEFLNCLKVSSNAIDEQRASHREAKHVPAA